MSAPARCDSKQPPVLPHSTAPSPPNRERQRTYQIVMPTPRDPKPPAPRQSLSRNRPASGGRSRPSSPPPPSDPANSGSNVTSRYRSQRRPNWPPATNLATHRSSNAASTSSISNNPSNQFSGCVRRSSSATCDREIWSCGAQPTRSARAPRFNLPLRHVKAEVRHNPVEARARTVMSH